MKRLFSKIKNTAKKVKRLVLVTFARAILVAIMGMYVIGCLTAVAAFERRASIIDIIS